MPDPETEPLARPRPEPEPGREGRRTPSWRAPSWRLLAAILLLLASPLLFWPSPRAAGQAGQNGLPGQNGPAGPPDQNGQADQYSAPMGEGPRPDPVVGPEGYLENGWLIWEELMPAGWDPAAIFEELGLNSMADDDPRVEQVIEEFVKRWNASPVNPGIDGRLVKIPGFVVPLDFEAEQVAEFFLVPFFGACIHVPPPPPNQIIMVRPAEPIRGLAAMEVVWVYGPISVEGYANELGHAGYAIAADKVEFYQVPEGY